jgi:uncharacterized delta-60 repeat protein
MCKKIKMKRNILIIIYILYINISYGQSGIIDSTFGVHGIVTTPIRYPGDDHGNSVALQIDGKIVVTGYSMDNNYKYDFATIRYNTNGTLDNYFGTMGKVITDFGNIGDDDIANSVAIQLNGKIVVGGSSSGDFALIRYNSDGSVDNSFGINGKVTTDFLGNGDVANSLAIQTDGKIIVAGFSLDSNNVSKFSLARYNINGTLDNSFGSSGKIIESFGNDNCGSNSLIIQSDNKIVLAGYFSGDFAISRFNMDGSIDNLFGTNGKIITDFYGNEDIGRCVAIQPDGRIIVTGNSSTNIALIRYNIDGTLDNSFGISGKIITNINNNEVANSIALQTDGKIIITGGVHYDSTSFDLIVLRYNLNGILDSSFGTNGKAITFIGNGDDLGNSVVIQNDGKIIVAGVSYNVAGIYGAEDEVTVIRYLSLNTGININDLHLQNSILIHPNPIESDAVIEYTIESSDVLSIKIYDIEGSLVKSVIINQNRVPGNYKDQLNIETLPSGIYILNIMNNSCYQNFKIVKK